MAGQQNNNLALKGRGCCLGKVFVSGFNALLSALKGGVLNPSQTIKKSRPKGGLFRYTNIFTASDAASNTYAMGSVFLRITALGKFGD
jgi:hypothetical protein